MQRNLQELSVLRFFQRSETYPANIGIYGEWLGVAQPVVQNSTFLGYVASTEHVSWCTLHFGGKNVPEVRSSLGGKSLMSLAAKPVDHRL